MQVSIPNNFLTSFSDEVMVEILKADSHSLTSTSKHPPRLYLQADEKKRLRNLAKKCIGFGTDSSDPFVDWFVLAYEAGLAQYCRNINGIIFVRTVMSYVEWKNLVEDYPAKELRRLLSDRRSDYEITKKTDPIKAERLLVLPLVEYKSVVDKEDMEEYIRRSKLLKYLCPALDTVTDDVFETVKIMTPILLGLILAGTISLPLAPGLFAAIALLISRVGVSALCVDYLNDNDDASSRKPR